jgi:uncharacterized lipoprotein YajG
LAKELNMPSNIRTALVLAFAALLAACAAPSHQVMLNPEPAVSPSEAGKSRVVTVQVADTRGRPHLGRPRQSEGGSAIIFTEQNIAEVVGAGVVASLEKKGFRAQVSPMGRRNLRVEVRALERTIEGPEFVAEALLEVTAVNESGDPGRRYRSQYRARYAERRPVDSRVVSERVLNAALNQALTQLVQDEKLLEFLAR